MCSRTRIVMDHFLNWKEKRKTQTTLAIQTEWIWNTKLPKSTHRLLMLSSTASSSAGKIHQHDTFKKYFKEKILYLLFVQTQHGDYENSKFNSQIYWKSTHLFCFPWAGWYSVKMQRSFVLTAEPLLPGHYSTGLWSAWMPSTRSAKKTREKSH